MPGDALFAQILHKRIGAVIDRMSLLHRIRRRRPLQRQDVEPPLHDPLVLGEEAMPADIDAVTLVVEGLGDAADGIGGLQHDHARIRALQQLVGCRQACWPGTGDDGGLLHRRTLPARLRNE